MALPLESDPLATTRRIGALDAYMSRRVLSGGQFICPHFAECRGSHPGEFFEGQLHHVGAHYDLSANGRPFRIAVVGQEYGNGPSGVSRIARTRMVAVDTGLKKRFRTDGLHPPRNPHMKGTTSVLRLLFGLGLGSDYDREFLALGPQRVHIFEAFALVNFLLCSAIAEGQGAEGSKRGQSTRTMQRNCSEHFRNVLDVLEPTVLIIQGRGVRRWLEPIVDGTERLGAQLERVRIGGMQILVASFTHPSVPSRDNWGTDERRPYLADVVAPTVRALHRVAVDATV